MPANDIQPSIVHATSVIGSVRYEIYNPHSGMYEPLSRENYPTLRGIPSVVVRTFRCPAIVRYIGAAHPAFFDCLFEIQGYSGGHYASCFPILHNGDLHENPMAFRVQDLVEVDNENDQ